MKKNDVSLVFLRNPSIKEGVGKVGEKSRVVSSEDPHFICCQQESESWGRHRAGSGDEGKRLRRFGWMHKQLMHQALNLGGVLLTRAGTKLYPKAF